MAFGRGKTTLRVLLAAIWIAAALLVGLGFVAASAELTISGVRVLRRGEGWKSLLLVVSAAVASSIAAAVVHERRVRERILKKGKRVRARVTTQLARGGAEGEVVLALRTEESAPRTLEVVELVTPDEAERYQPGSIVVVAIDPEDASRGLVDREATVHRVV
ncbi:MAG: hypothetical protein U0271_28535 [Polyangiaceae bacterium]